jgi:hypothetical protein
MNQIRIKKLKTKKKSSKIKTQQKQQTPIKHIYFVNKCYYYIMYIYLETYLKKLGVQPDKAMKIIEQRNKTIVKKHNMSYKKFCNFTQKIKLPSIEPGLIKADVFFYNIYNTYIDKQLYSYNKFLINILNINYNLILRKNVLYNNVYKYSPEIAKKYLIETFNINEIEKYHFSEYYILRPTIASQGTDIIYVHNKEELNDAIEFYNTTKNYKNKEIYGNNVVASKFITDLLLFQGKKFHLRIYYIVSCINGVINSFALDDGEIITAKEQYDLEIPYTKDKHDSHFNSNEKDFYISTDFNTKNLGIEMNDKIYTKIYNEIKIICSSIFKIIINNYSNINILHPNQKNGFHLFGLDIFIKSDLTPVLIECNMSPSINADNQTHPDIFLKMICDWINEIILEPLFKYNDPMIARKHSTYIDIKS